MKINENSIFPLIKVKTQTGVDFLMHIKKLWTPSVMFGFADLAKTT